MEPRSKKTKLTGGNAQQPIVGSENPPTTLQLAQRLELPSNAPSAPVPANAVKLPRAEVTDATPSPFILFGRDIRGVIADITSAAALANLVRTDKRTYALFQANMDKKAASVLLGHVLYGNKAEAEKMLMANPRLVLVEASGVDCAGNKIMQATAYEAALGAGDDDMAAMIGTYFAKLENGEDERSRQYAGYQPHIETMLTQPAYDFSALLQMIKESSAEDVQAALELKFNAELPLHAALDNFREHFAPREIKGGMHFNYANLLQAFNTYADEFNALHAAGGDNYSKCDLFWRQVIGYIQRGLPACDRQAYAQGLPELLDEPLRTFGFAYGGGASFPITQGDESRSGLGYEFAALPGDPAASLIFTPRCLADSFKTYVEQKLQACKTYAATAGRAFARVRNLLK